MAATTNRLPLIIQMFIILSSSPLKTMLVENLEGSLLMATDGIVFTKVARNLTSSSSPGTGFDGHQAGVRAKTRLPGTIRTLKGLLITIQPCTLYPRPSIRFSC